MMIFKYMFDPNHNAYNNIIIILSLSFVIPCFIKCLANRIQLLLQQTAVWNQKKDLYDLL